MSDHIRTFRSKKLHPEHVKLLNAAIRRNVKGGDEHVHITYQDAKGQTTERKVKPLGVKDTKLLAAHCQKRDAIRSFKVERITMIKGAFWAGFEKRAEEHGKPSKAPAMAALGAGALGGVVGAGAGLGGYVGSKGGKVISDVGRLKGGVLGAGIGAGGIPALLAIHPGDTTKVIKETLRDAKPKDRRMMIAAMAGGGLLGAGGLGYGAYKGTKAMLKKHDSEKRAGEHDEKKRSGEHDEKKRHSAIGAAAGGLAGAAGAGFLPGMKTKSHQIPKSLYSEALRSAPNAAAKRLRGDRRKVLLLLSGAAGLGGATAGGLAGLGTGHLADKAKNKGK